MRHSSITVTGGVYGQTSDTTARTAVDALADQLGLLDLSAAVAIPVAIQARRSVEEAAPDVSETASTCKNICRADRI
jgi:hypothetical protein